MKYADLHIHTNFSDGVLTPAEVVKRANEAGLSCIAITDHDAVGAIEPAIQEANNLNLEVIPGVELSAEIDDYEIHIIGYFIDWQLDWFRQKLEQICQVRKRRYLAILEKLKSCGLNLNPDEDLREAGSVSVGRLHIARQLKKQGFVYSIQEAFNKYIGNDCPCYVKKFKLTPAEAINMINRVNGVAVLSHPYNIGNDELIPEFAQLGLQGLEVYYPKHDEATTARYLNLAKKHGLLVTGGSDCHGVAKNSKAKGMMGEIKIPYELVEQLKKEAQGL